MTPLESFLARLSDARRSGGGWSAKCPAHEDRRASLSVTEGDDGRVLLHCHAGCAPAEIVTAVGLTMQDLFPPTGGRYPRLARPEGNGKAPGRIFGTSQAAIEYVESRHGRASNVWFYRARGGQLIGVILRWNLPHGAKNIRPISRRGKRWVIGGMLEPRPLYRLAELAGADRVFVCEGEKAADAACSIGLAATTSAHGSKSAMKSNWSPLAGKDVTILPDNDPAGRAYARSVAGILAGLDPPATIRIVELPGLPEHGDFYDWVNNLHGDAAEPDELRRQLEELADVSPIVTAANLGDATPAAEPERPADAAMAPVLVRLADVTPEPIRWLWPGRIALGKLTLLAGDPGLGKSFLSLDIAARVSRGGPWPDDPSARFDAGGVVLLSAEDDIADTIRPRLDAAGADVRRVRAITAIRGKDEEGTYERGVDLGRDLEHLETAIAETEHCQLVVIDPISAYLGKTDTHKNSAVRGLLAPVAELAARRHVAVVAITHLRKGDGPAIYRSIGSLAFTAAARAVWAVTKDKTDGARRLLLPVKNNLALDVEGMAFQVGSFGVNEQTALAWETAPVAVRAEDALGDKTTATERSDRDDAAAWLREALADGAMEASTVLSEAKQNGIPEKTLRRAFRDIGGKSKKSSFGGAWLWELAAEKPEDAQISRLF